MIAFGSILLYVDLGSSILLALEAEGSIFLFPFCFLACVARHIAARAHARLRCVFIHLLAHLKAKVCCTENAHIFKASASVDVRLVVKTRANDLGTGTYYGVYARAQLDHCTESSSVSCYFSCSPAIALKSLIMAS